MTDEDSVIVEGPVVGKRRQCEAILRALPDWFGVESAILRYASDIDSLPTFVAVAGGAVVGFLTLRRHTEFSGEIHVMAVRPEMHRRGIGRRLLERAEKWLAAENVEYLQVKTLAPSRPDDCYERTRSFYFAMGFRPLEELRDFWDANNPCLLMVKKLPGHTRAHEA